jgi:hypothetical protein
LTLTFSQPIDNADASAARRALSDIASMILTRVEAGGVDSIAVLFVGPGPKGQPETVASLGSRYFVRAEHLDFMEDVWLEMVDALIKAHGVTPDEVRANRAQSAARIERERNGG